MQIYSTDEGKEKLGRHLLSVHALIILEMHLLGIDIKEFPSAIGNLFNLGVLKLGTPSLETLPPSIGYLRSLENLCLQN